jgi:hypothetical protein
MTWWQSVPAAPAQNGSDQGKNWWNEAPAAPAPAPAQGYTPDTSTMAGRFADLGLSGLTAARELGEETIGQAGDVAMLGAQGMNAIARNFPQLGLHEVPREVLQRYMPFSTEELHQGVGKLLQKAGLPAEYTSPTEQGKAIYGTVKYAPLAFSVAKTLESAIPALGPKAAAGAATGAKAIQSVDDLEAAKTAAYRAADAQSGGLTSTEGRFVVQKMQDAADAANANPELHSKALSVLDKLKARLSGVQGEGFTMEPTPGMGEAQPTTLATLEGYRKQLSQIARKSTDETQQFMAGQLRSAYDDALDMIGQRNPLYRAARAANTTYRRAEAIQEVTDYAEKEVATGTKSLGEALRSRLKTLSNNERWMRQFPADQQERINQLVLGGRMQNFFNRLAKSQATGSVPAAILGYVTGGIGGAFGGPAVSQLVRGGLKAAAGRPTVQGFEELQRLIQAAPPGSALQKRLLARLDPEQVAELLHGALPLAVAGQPSGQ